MGKLPDECREHPDRAYVNLMATIALQGAVGIDDAVSILDEVREHERYVTLEYIKKSLEGDNK